LSHELLVVLQVTADETGAVPRLKDIHDRCVSHNLLEGKGCRNKVRNFRNYKALGRKGQKVLEEKNVFTHSLLEISERNYFNL
jgi:hypothetical protein